jgi:hypothetical protein
MENGQFAYGVLFQWKYKTYNILVLKKKLVIITYPKWKKYIFILALKQHCQLDQWRSFKYIFGRSKVKETTVCFTYKEFEEERKTEADLVDMGTRDHSLFH